MKTKLFLALAGAFLISTAANINASAATKDAAIDERGGAVRATNGTCVRTKWNTNSDICKPKPKADEPVAAPTPVVEKAPEPAPIKLAKELGKEEKNVYFDFDKAVLTAESQEKLDSLAKVLLSDKEVESVKIVAYADKMGSTEYNDKLSQKRAVAVNDYLNAKGYLKTTVAETAWLGESAPKTECPDSMKRAEKIRCLQEDRRAEVVINFSQIVEVPAEKPIDANEPKSGTPAPAATPAAPTELPGSSPTSIPDVIAPEVNPSAPADKPEAPANIL